jgi:hypothetical protein
VFTDAVKIEDAQIISNMKRRIIFVLHGNYFDKNTNFIRVYC